METHCTAAARHWESQEPFLTLLLLVSASPPVAAPTASTQQAHKGAKAAGSEGEPSPSSTPLSFRPRYTLTAKQSGGVSVIGFRPISLPGLLPGYNQPPDNRPSPLNTTPSCHTMRATNIRHACIITCGAVCLWRLFSRLTHYTCQHNLDASWLLCSRLQTSKLFPTLNLPCLHTSEYRDTRSHTNTPARLTSYPAKLCAGDLRMRLSLLPAAATSSYSCLMAAMSTRQPN